MIDELIDFHYKDQNEGKAAELMNQRIFDYFNDLKHSIYVVCVFYQKFNFHLTIVYLFIPII